MWARTWLDVLAHDAHARSPVLQNAPQGALRLVADEEHRRFLPPQPSPEVVTDAPGLAHPARGDDDVEAVDAIDSLALLDALCEADPGRVQGAPQRGARLSRER